MGPDMASFDRPFNGLPYKVRDATYLTLDERFTYIEIKYCHRGGPPSRGPYIPRQAPSGRDGGRPQRDDPLQGVHDGRVERRRPAPQPLLEEGFKGGDGRRLGGSPRRGQFRDKGRTIEFVNRSRRGPPLYFERDRYVEKIPKNNYNSRFHRGGGRSGVGAYGARNYRGGPPRRRHNGAPGGDGRGGGRGRGRGGRNRNQRDQVGAAPAAAPDCVVEEKPAMENAQLDEEMDDDA